MMILVRIEAAVGANRGKLPANRKTMVSDTIVSSGKALSLPSSFAESIGPRQSFERDI